MSQNKSALRSWLANRLGQPVPDVIWAQLEEKEYVSDAVDREGREYLLDMARRFLLVARELSKAGPVTRPSLATPSRTFDAELHARSELTAQAAASDIRVQRFRRAVLGWERPLSPTDAESFLDSPLSAWCVPLRRRLAIVNLRVVGLHEEQGPTHGQVLMRFEVDDRGRRREIRCARPVSEATHTLEYRRPDGAMWRLMCRPDSYLDQLSRTAQRVAPALSWDAAAAAAFILEGAVPEISALVVEVQTSNVAVGRIRIDAAEWVAPEDVDRAYRQARASIGARRAPLRRHTAELVEFVSARRSRGKPWRAIRAEWDAAHPEHAFRDHRHLRQAFVRASARLTDTLDPGSLAGRA